MRKPRWFALVTMLGALSLVAAGCAAAEKPSNAAAGQEPPALASPLPSPPVTLAMHGPSA